METKKIIFIVAGLAVLGFITALILFNMNNSDASDTASNSSDSSEQLTMHEQYPGLPEQNRFVPEPASKIIDRFKNGTGIIFLGFKECPWCQKTAPILNEAAEKEGVSIYYLDIKKERQDLTPEYNQIISILTPHLPKNEDGAPTISTPDISFVKNGEIIWRHEMDATTEAERTPDTYWTEQRQARAIENFSAQAKKLKEA